MLKASSLQGRGKFEEVIEIATRARKLRPKSQMAFLLLCEDLIRLNRDDEAKATLEEALEAHPKDYLFNIWYAQLLENNNAPIEKIILHVMQYIDEKPKTQNGLPFYMKGFVKAERIKNLEKSMNSSLHKYDKWAEGIIKIYRQKQNAT